MGWLRWYPAPPAPPPDNLTSFLSKLSQNTRTGFYLVNLNYHLIPSHLQQRKTKCRFLSILASYWALLVLLKVSVCIKYYQVLYFSVLSNTNVSVMICAPNLFYCNNIYYQVEKNHCFFSFCSILSCTFICKTVIRTKKFIFVSITYVYYQATQN